MSNYCSVEISGEVVLSKGIETYMVEDFLAWHELSRGCASFFVRKQKLVLTYSFSDHANYGRYTHLPKAQAFLEDVERYLAAEAWLETCHGDSDNGGPYSDQVMRGSRTMVVEKRLREIPNEIAALRKELAQLKLERADLNTSSTTLSFAYGSPGAVGDPLGNRNKTLLQGKSILSCRTSQS